MPELPEVEVIRHELSDLLPGKKIKDIQTIWPKSIPLSKNDLSKLEGATIKSVERRGKMLIIGLNNDYSLVIHLKMTGQLVYRGERYFGGGHPNDSLVGDLPDKSTRVIFDFEGNKRLFFNDQRKFGWIHFMPTAEVGKTGLLHKLGPEPLDKNFTAADFRTRLMRRANSGIKSVLLDQSVVAGVGNIYSDESLWSAKIHPLTHVKDLSSKQTAELFDGLKRILKMAISKGGSSDRNYVDSEGRKGHYLEFANVFRRKGEPCPRCGTLIIKTRVAGRGTYLCPKEQKLPK